MAFIEKSKKHHPDKNPDVYGTKMFVAINEAYSVLGKYFTRKEYDNELLFQRQMRHVKNTSEVHTDAPIGTVIFRDSSLWEQRDKSKYENFSKDYYGVKGIEKVSNSVVVCGILVFMFTGAIFHFFITKASSSFVLKQLDAKTKEASEMYTKVRSEAESNGVEKQVDKIKNRLINLKEE